MTRTSTTHPIRVDVLHVRAGMLGLTFCPGKHGDSLNGAPWARDLDADLAALKDWGARLVVSLLMPEEFAWLQVRDLGICVKAHDMEWAHVPIPDQGIPEEAFHEAWPCLRDQLLGRLDAGERVLLHCRGGLGRTGLVAALVLVEPGMAADTAMQAVRKVRPGAIETDAQENYVLGYQRDSL